MSTFSLPAPCKINLFLHILGRRADGYHRLQTLFRLLDKADAVSFSPAERLILEGTEVGRTSDNLVWRAATALQKHTGTNHGARLHLEKNLPVGAGLGGGSSDAATTLLGLNHLWNLHLSLDELSEIAGQLGADVPVFVKGHSAFAEGIGDILTPVQLPPQLYLVVFPGVSVATTRIFADSQLTRNTPESTVAAFLEPGTAVHFHNDCEAVATRLFPEIGAALRWLEDRLGNSRMTGTGSCVFSRLTSRHEGQVVLDKLPLHWKGFMAEACNISPLHEALDRLAAC